jgi:hypothetical protein
MQVNKYTTAVVALGYGEKRVLCCVRVWNVCGGIINIMCSVFCMLQ